MNENQSPATELAPEIREFVAGWSQGASTVLSQLSGAPVLIGSSATKPVTAPEAAGTDLRFVVSAGGTLRGEMSLQLPPSTAVVLAQMLLGEGRDAAAEFKPEHAEAVEELLRQISGHVVSALKPKWGEVQLGVARAETPAWSAAASGWLHSASGTDVEIALAWSASAALAAALRPQEAAPTASPAANLDAAGDRLDLLMDVELGLTLRFGSRDMALREILDLNAGSVLQLDRQVEDPAELLLDGRLIARGDVVVVEGNYGFRVTEVMAAQSER